MAVAAAGLSLILAAAAWDVPQPVAQTQTARYLGSSTSPNDWKMTSTFEAVDFQYNRITWFTFDVDFRFGTRRAAWPTLAWFVTWPFTGCWPGLVDFVWRVAFESIVGAMFVVPLDDQCHFSLELQLVF